MSIIQLMFLACWAMLDLALVIWSPSRKWSLAVQGLPKREVLARWKQPNYAAKGCELVAGNTLELLVTLVVEPGYVLWALSAHVGSSLVALGMGSILVANVLTSLIKGYQERKQETFPVLNWVRGLGIWFCSIPTLYLWYLLLVLLGVLR